MSFQSTEHIQIVPVVNGKNIRWQPVIGRESLALLQDLRIQDSEKNKVRDEAVSILSKCVPPDGPPEKLTGLVMGYVQSGKTMSFVTVSALARDNHYQMIIIIAGTSLPLLNQSTNRLKRDLKFETRDDRAWLHIESKSLNKNTHEKINSALSDWTDNSVVSAHRKTVLITVMKNHAHLKKVYQVLEKVNIKSSPVIIIDDEADQASLNTKVNSEDASTTYRWILRLKDLIQHHTFLQYTATPQAPLLINIIDVLSPRFVSVLNPGLEYVGGKEFFVESPSLINRIPEDDIPLTGDSLNEPPESLLHAMRLFFIGVACGILLDSSRGNRSMLVHPSHKTINHYEFYNCIKKVKERWEKTFLQEDNDIDKRDLIQEFREAYQELQKTVRNLPAFDDIQPKIKQSIRGTQLEEVNSSAGKTPNINWKENYSFILVGGQAMDRGFTVEGLTVTYMPRGAGTGAVDTIQQRARFFGYKRNYLGYCRVFLENNVCSAYRQIIIHEEDVRRQMIEFDKTGEPLSSWKRAFFLEPSLRPTRKEVIDLEYFRGRFDDDWFTIKAPHSSLTASLENKQLIDRLLEGLLLEDDTGDSRRTQIQRHKVARNLLLKKLYTDLLISFRVAFPSDSQKFTGLMLQLASFLETHPSEVCTLYLMSNGMLRKRKPNNENVIPTLFQGANANTGYLGDREVYSPKCLTIQIHFLEIESSDLECVPTIAIRVPKKMAADWLVQESAIIG